MFDKFCMSSAINDCLKEEEAKSYVNYKFLLKIHQCNTSDGKYYNLAVLVGQNSQN